MSDRLNDLHRQRALAQEQVAWFDREIARETNTVPAAAAIPAAVSLPAPVSAPQSAAQAEELIERYAPKGKPVRDQVKQGCLLYLGIAFAVVGLGILALYLSHRAK